MNLKTTPHPHRFFYGVLAGLILSFSLVAPSLAAPRARQEYIDAADPTTPLNVSKYTKDSQEADWTHFGDAIFPVPVSNPSPGSIPYLHQGAGIAVINGVSYLAGTPPIKTSDYVAYALNNLGVVPQAYAQGIGFSSLSPLLEVWKAFRNIAYFLFTGAFLIVGFMIMFRAKIDPQTVVSIQAALPKLIITLILITFSYAIAGFIIDLIYLVTFVVFEVFRVSGIISDQTLALNTIFGESIFQVGWKYFVKPNQAAGSGANAVSDIIAGLLGNPGGLTGYILDFITDSLGYLIIAVMILIALVRTFIGLLMAYIGIIISVIFAPLQLLMNAFPGSNTFAGWIRGLAANAAVFPAVAIMVVIGAYLAGGNTAPMGVNSISTTVLGPSGTGGTGAGFVPPLIISGGYNWGSSPTSQPFGLLQLRALIGLGFIMLLPEVVKVVKNAFQIKDSGATSGAFGSAGSAAGLAFALPKMYGRQKREGRAERHKAQIQAEELSKVINPGKTPNTT